jgi:uncharacterized protein (DUF433 family)
MMIASPNIAVPLRVEPDGTIRVGQSRVILDLVIYAFQKDSTPEAIVNSFPTLRLSDVYLVLGYYLENRAEVEAYLRRREAEAQELQEKMERMFPQEGIRARLLAQREAKRTEKPNE